MLHHCRNRNNKDVVSQDVQLHVCHISFTNFERITWHYFITAGNKCSIGLQWLHRWILDIFGQFGRAWPVLLQSQQVNGVRIILDNFLFRVNSSLSVKHFILRLSSFLHMISIYFLALTLTLYHKAYLWTSLLHEYLWLFIHRQHRHTPNMFRFPF